MALEINHTVGIQNRIEKVGIELPDNAYDDTSSSSPEQLEALWEGIPEIYIEAIDCSQRLQDENAWSLVVYDILKFALRHSPILRLKNIKLQTIQSELLPCLPPRDLSHISSGKVNFAFALSTQGPEIEKLLWQFEHAQVPLGLTTDPGLS